MASRTGEQGYVSAGQLGEDIGRYLKGRPVVAGHVTLAYRARHFVGRNRAVLVAGVFASLAAFALVAGWQARRAEAGRVAAEAERARAEKVVGVLVGLFERANPRLHPDGDRISTRELLDQAEPRVMQRLESEPAVRARLREVFGLIHAARDQLPEARAALEQALAEQRRLLGPDHPDPIDTLYYLGRLHEALGDEPGAHALLEEALERCLRVFGENDERTARTLSALATPDRLEESGELLRRALGIRRKVLSPDHPDIAENLGQLAYYHRRRGEKAKAVRLYAEALAMFPTSEQRRDPKAITLLNDYGVLLGDLRESAKAEAMLREALGLARAVFGADSLQTATGLNNLAGELAGQGRLEEAVQTFQESYARHRAVLGEDHWRTVNAARNIGWILALRQHDAEGLEWMDRALASLRRRTPVDRRGMPFQVQGRRALILLRLGRPEEAIRILESTLAAHAEAKIPGTESIGTDLEMGLALALLETGRGAEAVPHARTAFARAEPESTIRTQAECLLGGALRGSGAEAEGRALLDDCLPSYRRWGLADRRLVVELDAALAR